jgi:hypothetical protein
MNTDRFRAYWPALPIAAAIGLGVYVSALAVVPHLLALGIAVFLATAVFGWLALRRDGPEEARHDRVAALLAVLLVSTIASVTTVFVVVVAKLLGAFLTV